MSEGMESAYEPSRGRTSRDVRTQLSHRPDDLAQVLSSGDRGLITQVLQALDEPLLSICCRLHPEAQEKTIRLLLALGLGLPLKDEHCLDEGLMNNARQLSARIDQDGFGRAFLSARYQIVEQLRRLDTDSSEPDRWNRVAVYENYLSEFARLHMSITYLAHYAEEQVLLDRARFVVHALIPSQLISPSALDQRWTDPHLFTQYLVEDLHNNFLGTVKAELETQGLDFVRNGVRGLSDLHAVQPRFFEELRREVERLSGYYRQVNPGAPQYHAGDSGSNPPDSASFQNYRQWLLGSGALPSIILPSLGYVAFTSHSSGVRTTAHRLLKLFNT